MIKFALYGIFLVTSGILISNRLSGKSRDYSTLMRYVLIIDLICIAILKTVEFVRG